MGPRRRARNPCGLTLELTAGHDGVIDVSGLVVPECCQSPRGGLRKFKPQACHHCKSVFYPAVRERSVTPEARSKIAAKRGAKRERRELALRRKAARRLERLEHARSSSLGDDSVGVGVGSSPPRSPGASGRYRSFDAPVSSGSAPSLGFLESILHLLVPSRGNSRCASPAAASASRAATPVATPTTRGRSVRTHLVAEDATATATAQDDAQADAQDEQPSSSGCMEMLFCSGECHLTHIAGLQDARARRKYERHRDQRRRREHWNKNNQQCNIDSDDETKKATSSLSSLEEELASW